MKTLKILSFMFMFSALVISCGDGTEATTDEPTTTEVDATTATEDAAAAAKTAADEAAAAAAKAAEEAAAAGGEAVDGAVDAATEAVDGEADAHKGHEH